VSGARRHRTVTSRGARDAAGARTSSALRRRPRRRWRDGSRTSGSWRR